jgi:hypothetical protein
MSEDNGTRSQEARVQTILDDETVIAIVAHIEEWGRRISLLPGVSNFDIGGGKQGAVTFVKKRIKCRIRPVFGLTQPGKTHPPCVIAIEGWNKAGGRDLGGWVLQRPVYSIQQAASLQLVMIQVDAALKAIEQRLELSTNTIQQTRPVIDRNGIDAMRPGDRGKPSRKTRVKPRY